MAQSTQKLSGRVIRKPVAAGSKSEHAAVVLKTAAGEEFVLRRLGGNAFSDPQLDELVGSSITGEGQISGQTFILKTWKVDGN
jgi:hypothetical protein